MRTPLLFLAAVLAALALAAAGCGGDDDEDSGTSGNSNQPAQATETSPEASAGGGKATELKLIADPGGALKFDKTKLTAKPGKVVVVMDNPSDIPHAVEVEGNGVEKASEVVTGATSQVEVDLKPGDYEFYCPVGNHRQAGMEGTLTVK
ncbi:MAG: hypothetical protein QOH58_3235 [Thermoleophilaceae bacterium]|jgi:uncharacterized cupredoxin-like copper-binding protein|nr:hypothetical protein [Thermoleophilaceae bacterium]